MKQVPLRILNILGRLILLLSAVVFLINHFFYKYSGNNYFPQGVPGVALMLIFLNLGLIFCFEKGSKYRQIGEELIHFFCVMSVIAIATNAIQLTPFPTIDHLIVKLEEYFNIHIPLILEWTNNHPKFKYILAISYDSLTNQMTFLPLLIIFSCRFHLIREYYFYLLITTLIGFSFYYFFPTTAPASVINSSLFSSEQIDTGLKFNQIHHFINPTTLEGGLIALPSFHTIWAILCVNLIKEWPIPCFLLLLNNFLLIASCILLGWHYCSDIFLGLIILLMAYYFFRHWQTN